MRDAERFPFVSGDSELGQASLLPRLPVTLIHQTQSIATIGLLDTGATVNVLPYQIGIELGATWQPELATIKLSGNLAGYDASPLIVYCARA